MSTLSMEDVVWLTSDRAKPYLERAAIHRDSLTSLANSLRKELSAQQTHLILEQVELRARARAKFEHADRMFFTRQTLQQATNEDIARYVASRFPRELPVADLCCGIGGNLLALAERGPATGVEQDPMTAHFADCNARIAGRGTVKVQVANAASFPLPGYSAFFIDPDRRAHGRRTVDLEYYQPDLAALERLISICPNAAVKLAPATAVPDRWRRSAELEWIGYARECKQQIAWFGELARHPGLRVATVIQRGHSNVRTIVESPGAPPSTSDQFQKFIYIPHAAVRTARLVDSIARGHSLAKLHGIADLLTSEQRISDNALTAFESVAECTFDLSKIRSLLEEHRIAPSIIRMVGHPGGAAKLAEKLPRDGNRTGGVFVCGQGSKRQATVAIRREQAS